jgi:hypothetical protein
LRPGSGMGDRIDSVQIHGYASTYNKMHLL